MLIGLAELISRAVEQTLEDRVAVSFSGGLDSTIIATIARKYSQVELFTAGVIGSDDLEYADAAAKELGLPLTRVVLDEDATLSRFRMVHSVVPLDLLKVEILVPVHAVAEAAARKGHTAILFGTAAEELFVGYERYFQYREEGKDIESVLKEEYRTLPHRDMAYVKKVCRGFGLDARFPFYNDELASAMFAVPLDERMHDRELKKCVLREAGKMLGAPESALRRRKRAMQYGSGVHKLIMRNSERINREFPAQGGPKSIG